MLIFVTIMQVLPEKDVIADMYNYSVQVAFLLFLNVGPSVQFYQGLI